MKDLRKLFGIIFVAAIIVCAMAACELPVGPNPDPTTPTTPPTTVTSIAITTPPTKTQYNLGEELNTTGMVVTATYSDGSTAAVMGYATSGYTKTVLGNQTVTVTYSSKTAVFTVNVIDPNRQTVATPAPSVAAGTYNAAQSVTLSCATENATIYYTTNGNNPTETSNKYTGAISIGVTTTLKAIAVKEGMNNSGILTAVYTLQALKPTANPAAGAIQKGTEVTLATATEGAEIWYTTNDSVPAKNGAGSTKYTAKIAINAAMTIKAIAVKNGWGDSGILTIAYTVPNVATVATPTANPAAGVIQQGTEITLATATEGAEIWYTTNGSAPAKNGAGSTKYTAKIAINAATTIKAIAVKNGWGDSGILTVAYTVSIGTPTIDLGNGLYLLENANNRDFAIEARLDAGQWSNVTSKSGHNQVLAEISNKVYAKFHDDFDFILFVLNTKKDNAIINALGFYGINVKVSNNVKGLGNDTYSYGSYYGSAEKLKSMMYLPYYDAITYGPSLHEVAHNWAAFFATYNVDNTPCIDHWGVSNAGGQLGGFKYVQEVPTSDGTKEYQGSMDGTYKDGFKTGGYGSNNIPYSDIELYLMGMIGAEELRANDFRLDIYTGLSSSNTSGPGYFKATGKNSYTIDKLISLKGARVPDAINSQKEFKVLTVILSNSQDTTASTRYDEIVKEVKWFAGYSESNGLYNFKQATRGIGSLEVSEITKSLK
jgi:hypothetical protein